MNPAASAVTPLRGRIVGIADLPPFGGERVVGPFALSFLGIALAALGSFPTKPELDGMAGERLLDACAAALTDTGVVK